MDLSKIRRIAEATQELAQQQQQVNQASQAPQAATGVSDMDPATSKALNQLGQVLTAAGTTNASQTSNAQTDLQRNAALLSAEAKALVGKADELEEKLNMAATPDYVGVEDLLKEMKEITEMCEREMRALQQKVQEQKDADKMDLKQKPTAMKAGEHVGDLSPNTTLSML